MGDPSAGSNTTGALQEDEDFRSHYVGTQENMDVTIIGPNTTGTPRNTMEANITCTDNCFLFGLLRERPQDVLIVFRMLLSLLLFTCSCLTILVTRRSARLKERPSATFVTNLAGTGGVMGLLVFVSSAVHQISRMSQRGVAVCLVLLPRFLHAVTTLTLACLTLDRYLALCWPLRYPALLTDSRCLQLVLGSWLLPAVVLSMTCLFGEPLSPCPDVRPYLISYLLVFTSAIAAVVVMYFLIAREFRRPIGGAVGGEELEEARRRTARELMVVVLLNLLLATPDVFTKLYLLTCPETLPVLYHVAPLLLLVHLICFYPLYAWKNRDFRSATKDACVSFKTSCARVLSRMSCKVSFVRDSFASVSLGSVSSSRISSTATNTTVSTTTTGGATADGATTGSASMSRVSAEKELPATAPTPSSASPSSSSLSSSSCSFSSSSSPTSVTAVPPSGQDNATFQT